MTQRARPEVDTTRNVDRERLVERLIVRDATHAMLTTIRLYF